jgi:STE24 endopeptidase
LWDQVKGSVVSGLLGLFVLELIYWLLRITPDFWWFWTFCVVAFFSVVLSALAPVLIFPLFYKFVPLADEDLCVRLLNLSEKAGARVQGVFTYDESRKTSQANAALTGLGSTRRIILADTLAGAFSHDEIEVILAHELGHHVHRDLVSGIAVQSLLNLLGFWVAGRVMLLGTALLGLRGVADPAGIPLLGLALSVYGLVVMPAGNAWSRWRERMADGYALRLTGKPDAFISGMTRLANQNLAEAEPPVWAECLLHSHPSIARRLATAQTFRQEEAS